MYQSGKHGSARVFAVIVAMFRATGTWRDCIVLILATWCRTLLPSQLFSRHVRGNPRRHFQGVSERHTLVQTLWLHIRVSRRHDVRAIGGADCNDTVSSVHSVSLDKSDAHNSATHSADRQCLGAL